MLLLLPLLLLFQEAKGWKCGTEGRVNVAWRSASSSSPPPPTSLPPCASSLNEMWQHLKEATQLVSPTAISRDSLIKGGWKESR